jgi:hypothetical protein
MLLLLLQSLTRQVLPTNVSLFTYVIIAMASFFTIWAIVSIPLWISAKMLRAKQASFTRSMLVTAIGPIVYAIVFLISTKLLSSLFTIENRNSLFSANATGIVIAFLAWIYIFKRGFETGWLKATGIAILAIIVFVIIGIITAFAINYFAPHFYAPPIIIPPPRVQQI